jgi:hypothetical protein
MTTSAEKLVKQTVKLIAKTQQLDYEELKIDVKKIIKLARNYDDELLGVMEELMDLSNVGSVDELSEFNPDVLKIYCKIKDIDDSGSDKSLRLRVWKHMEEEFELDTESEDESVVETDDESVDQESVVEEVEPAVEEKTKKSKKAKEPKE